MPVSGSTLVRRQLGRRLKTMRRSAGKTVDDVVATKIMSAAKLFRIEAGSSPVRTADVWALCRIYSADDKTTEALSSLAVGTNGKNWWHDYAGQRLPTDFAMYLGLEADAAAIRIYEPELVHGLFQTPAYAREIERATSIPAPGEDDIGDDTIDRYVALRMQRQKTVLGRKSPGQIVAVLGAPALSWQVGGPDVMAEQVEHLREIGRLRHVDLRVLPFSTGSHAAMFGGFAVMDFVDAEDPPVAYFETYTGAGFNEKEDQLPRYRTIFESIHQDAVPIEEYTP